MHKYHHFLHHGFIVLADKYQVIFTKNILTKKLHNFDIQSVAKQF